MSRSIRRVVVRVWVAVSLVTFAVWAAICLIGGQLVVPWFLWSVVVGAVVVGVVHAVSSREGSG
ncbi:hypothetical protein WEH80_09475 [Actinomycetes bacterium KLBMP 9759]